MNYLAFSLIFNVLLCLCSILYWRKSVSKTAELTAAVDAVVAEVQTLKDAQANVTPDSEVQAQVDRLTALVAPPSA